MQNTNNGDECARALPDSELTSIPYKYLLGQASPVFLQQINQRLRLMVIKPVDRRQEPHLLLVELPLTILNQ